MKLHAKLSKFHIEHTQIGATVQHMHSIQVIRTSCPKQQLGILQASKLYATVSQYENKRHGHEVQVKHYNTWTLSYLQKQLEHAQTHMVRLQVITISDFAENNIRLQCLELSNKMLHERIIEKQDMAWYYEMHRSKVFYWPWAKKDQKIWWHPRKHGKL